MSFVNKVAVITGASSGIGHALSKTLAAKGCRVGLIARRADRLAVLTDEIMQSGGHAVFAVADIAEREQTLAAIQQVRDQLGPIDLMVANAGIGSGTALEPLDSALVERTFRVNTLGAVYAIEGVLPEMLRRGQGHLAAVSSLAAYKGLPGESAYCASKAALNTYMEGLRIQLRSRGIAVTTICPGFVRTAITEAHKFHMPFLMDADRAAEKIALALERRKKVYNFPWQMSLLMKLTRWAPDWLMAWGLQGIGGERSGTPT